MEECRNRIVTARKYAIDLRFSEFEQGYFSQNRWAGFGATLAALGLTAAGSLSGTGTAQALSAAASGVTGGRAAYEREILAERTLLTIDTAMHAQRDLIAVNIRDGLNKSAREYPLGTALSDLDAYYRAGTVVGALTAVSQTVGAQAEVAQARLRNVLPLTRTSAAEYLRNRLRSGDEALIRAQMQAAGVSDRITVTRFVYTGQPAQVEMVARALGWISGTGDAVTPVPAEAQSAPPPSAPIRAPSPRPLASPLTPSQFRPQLPPATPDANNPPAAQAPASQSTARQYLRELGATPGGEDLIRQQMRALRLPDRMTVARFVNTSTGEQLEAVARPLGWTP